MVDGGRPSGVPDAEISLWINDRLVLEGRLVPNAATGITVTLPDSLGGNSTDGDPGLVNVRLETSTFNPKDLSISDDGRDLGVRVHRVDFE